MATKKAAPSAVADKLAAKAGKTKIPKEMTGEDPPPKPLPKGFKIPKTLAACADLYYEVRERRLAAEKAIDAEKAVESALQEHLIASLPKQEASGVSGRLCSVSVVQKEVPKVEDWSKVYAYIVEKYQKGKRSGNQDAAFALLGRSIGKAAVQEAWAEKRKVPGVGSFKVTTLSVSKIA
jgi:hypothetical protein